MNIDDLKPGMKVLLKNDLTCGETYGSKIFVIPMRKFRGTIVTIDKINCRDNSFRVKEIDCYWFTPEMIEMRKEKEIKKKFTKDDLKSGYVVKLRCGTICMVMRANQNNFTRILIDDTGVWHYISSWDNDLCWCVNGDEKLDIMEIYGLVNCGLFSNARSLSVYGRPLLWKRKETIELTIEEISKKLGYDVKVVASHK